MPSRPPNARPSAPKHTREVKQKHQRIRGRAGVTLRERIRQEEPLCRACLVIGRTSATTEIDHIKPLAHGGSNDRSNLQGLCYPCHKDKTELDRYGPEIQARRLPRDLTPSAIPLTMVCGPPGSGKSTYVRERATLDDMVIDLDVIMADLSGHAIHADKPGWLERGLVERNNRLRLLGQGTTRHKRAWFIIACPDGRERAWWASTLGAEVVILAPPLSELTRRIRSDPTRKGREDQMIEWATKWWQTFDATIGQMRADCS